MSISSQPDAAPWTISRLLSWTTEFLARKAVDDPRLAGEVLLAHAARCRRIDLYARFETVLDSAALTQFRASVKRAGDHEPIAYLVGEKEFFSLRFHVTPEVLIPRAETEELVECAIDLCRAAGWDAPRLWDVGTGSGCIAVSVLSQLSTATCLATDASVAALEIARQNATRHGLVDRVTFLAADALSIGHEAAPAGGFHLILCNPPYIPASQVATLDRAVRDFEPRSALTDEADGLNFYRTLAAGAASWLTPDGLVVIEIADGCAEAVIKIMTATGSLAHVQTRKDRVVGKERVLVFKKL